MSDLISREKHLITQSELKEIVSFYENTGQFTWIKNPKNGRKLIGTIAGNLHKSSGYWQIKINNIEYMAHRLAWLYVYGDFPKIHIDHINHDRADNRLKNLREVNHGENQQNLKDIKRNTKSGLLGVSVVYGRFQARIKASGIFKSLGTYDTAEEAHQAYLKAKRELHPFGTI